MAGHIRGLVHSKIAACAAKNFVFGGKVDELETITESILLANQGTNRYGAARKLEAQLYDLAQRNLNCQHGGDPRFANVDATALQQAACPGVDGDINLEVEAGTPAGIRNCPMTPDRRRILSIHVPNFLRSTLAR
jgi:hypothetical protein